MNCYLFYNVVCSQRSSGYSVLKGSTFNTKPYSKFASEASLFISNLRARLHGKRMILVLGSS